MLMFTVYSVSDKEQGNMPTRMINKNMYRQYFQQRMGQPGMVVNSGRGQLDRENVFFRVTVCA